MAVKFLQFLPCMIVVCHAEINQLMMTVSMLWLLGGFRSGRILNLFLSECRIMDPPLLSFLGISFVPGRESVLSLGAGLSILLRQLNVCSLCSLCNAEHLHCRGFFFP